MLTWVQFGLLTTTIACFITFIQPQLQQDPLSETAALLRVLLYNTNKTLFESDSPPTLLTWAGAPTFLVASQITLYICLSIILLCGSLLILMKFIMDSKIADQIKPTTTQFISDDVPALTYVLVCLIFNRLLVALILQLPYLPSVPTVHFGVLGKTKE